MTKMTEFVLVVLIALGVALSTQWLQPRFMATNFGTKLQQSKAGALLTTTLVVLVGVLASAFVIGLATKDRSIAISTKVI